MVKLIVISLAPASLLATATGHASVKSPTPRLVGPAMQAACGAARLITPPLPDLNGPAALQRSILNTMQKPVISTSAEVINGKIICISNTRVYKPDTAVTFHVDIQPCHTGYANVTIYNTVTQRAIAPALKTWPVYADDVIPPWEWPPDKSDFTVTIPDLGTQCSQPGACIIQWWWYAYNRQTYESCVDFTQ
ncbi:hypothetical protein AX16_000802 [Volvariella volvacea WC 439]|nr:hypothetical protein AX16_000802 [Volvariella volvacea WC 439]